jgi:hypothetical protein
MRSGCWDSERSARQRLTDPPPRLQSVSFRGFAAEGVPKRWLEGTTGAPAKLRSGFVENSQTWMRSRSLPAFSGLNNHTTAAWPSITTGISRKAIWNDPVASRIQTETKGHST